MTFAYPYFLAAPLLIFAAFLFRRPPVAAVNCADSSLLREVPKSLRLIIRTPLLFLLAAAFISLLSIAAARPQKITSVQDDYEGRDLMLVLDVSGSMKERDFEYQNSYINRLQAVKLVVSEFIKERVGDRIGLVAFGTTAFLQSPLTLDHPLLVQLINMLQVGVVGEGTAIGEGIGVALKRLRDIEGKSKAIILLTDGANNAGKVLPLQAAKVAGELGIKIHTIGIGSKQAAPRGLGGMFIGNAPEFDEQTLRQIAESSAGVYFKASDLEELSKVYAEIDKLEKREDSNPARQIIEERFGWYAAGALLAFMLFWILSRSVFLKVP